jgi:shikimate kinase
VHAGRRQVDKPLPNVYLIGPMGSGKTTIGQRVAARLGLDFLDCDHELEAQTGASVNLIFDVEGEAGFRARETRMLRKLTARRGVLVATGGGVVLRPKNRELLRQTGLIVYLRTTVAQQLRRLGRDKTRPLLQTPDRKERLERLAEERNPLYADLADIDFPARNRSPDTAAQALADLIRAHCAEDGPKLAFLRPERASH